MRIDSQPAGGWKLAWIYLPDRSVSILEVSSIGQNEVVKRVRFQDCCSCPCIRQGWSLPRLRIAAADAKPGPSCHPFRHAGIFVGPPGSAMPV